MLGASLIFLRIGSPSGWHGRSMTFLSLSFCGIGAPFSDPMPQLIFLRCGRYDLTMRTNSEHGYRRSGIRVLFMCALRRAQKKINRKSPSSTEKT